MNNKNHDLTVTPEPLNQLRNDNIVNLGKVELGQLKLEKEGNWENKELGQEESEKRGKLGGKGGIWIKRNWDAYKAVSDPLCGIKKKKFPMDDLGQ